MTMNPRLKNILLIIAKNAVNAVITNTALIGMMHNTFNTSSVAGWQALGKATLAVVAGREIVVFLPIVLKWSSTSANPSAIELPSDPPGGKGGIYVPPEPPKGN